MKMLAFPVQIVNAEESVTAYIISYDKYGNLVDANIY